MTAHIAYTKIPNNASPERTCLNEELVEFPEEVADHTEAINYRLEHADLTRKIGSNQVRVIRVMRTGSHDAMKRIEEEGRLPEWYADNLAWLRGTFGAENVVSSVVHRDESTPQSTPPWCRSLRASAARPAPPHPKHPASGTTTRNPLHDPPLRR